MKSNFRIFIYLLVGLLNVNNNCVAQTKPPAPWGDTSEPFTMQKENRKDQNDSVNYFNEFDTIKKYRSTREFAYMNYLDSVLRTVSDLKNDTVRLDEHTGKIIRNKKAARDVSAINRLLNSLPLKIFFWILAFLFIVFISYRLLFKNKIFRRRSGQQMDKDEDENLQELSELSKYDTFIAEAEKAANYNLAIRYLFLKTLKNLTDKELISFAPAKTNREYIKEMDSNNLSSEFESLTHNYEYIWYGKFLVGTDAYQRLKEEFNLFNQKV